MRSITRTFIRPLATGALAAGLVAGAVSGATPALGGEVGPDDPQVALEATLTCHEDTATYTIDWWFGATDPAGVELEVTGAPVWGSAGIDGDLLFVGESFIIPDHFETHHFDIPGDTAGTVNAEVQFQVEGHIPEARSNQVELDGQCGVPETTTTTPDDEDDEPGAEVESTSTARPAQPVAMQPQFTG
jgi:hypothetical protein